MVDLMLLSSISFSLLDPVALQLGPVQVRWYGLAYLVGFLLAFIVLRTLRSKGILRLSASALSDLMGVLALAVIVGGRLGWWIFYHRGYNGDDPWYEPLALWHGGMSFHGGLAGVGVALTLFAWRRAAPFWNLADCAALVAPLGLFFGRIANFINAELVGRVTTVPWAVVFPGDTVPRHPSQLYEAVMEGPLLLAIVLFGWKYLKGPEGRVAWLFLIAYGLLRFLVEFTRQPDEQIGFIAFGWLTMGQLLSLALSAVGVGCWIFRASASDENRVAAAREPA